MIEKQKIIISHFQKGKSQRQIARQMGLNRRTIARYIKDYERKKSKLTDSKGDSNKEELIADIIENPKYDTSNRKRVKLTEEIIDRIKFYLKENETKRIEGKTKQQKKKIDICTISPSLLFNLLQYSIGVKIFRLLFKILLGFPFCVISLI